MNFIYFLIFIISVILVIFYFWKTIKPTDDINYFKNFFKCFLLCFIFTGISVFSCFKAFKIEEKMKLKKIKEQQKFKEDYIRRFEIAKNTVIIKTDSVNEQQEIIDYAESKGFDLKATNGSNILVFKKKIKEW